MNGRGLQFFFIALFCFVGHAHAAALEPGTISRATFTDVEGRRFCVCDGRATLLSVATRQTEPKARQVGHNVPNQYVGHPHYRFVTVINFQKQIPSFLRRIISAVVRRRFRAEVNRVQARYSAQKIGHSPRLDLFAIADFEGQAVGQLGIDPASNEFAVFVFDGRGQLIHRWRDVPSREELRTALTSAL